MKSKTRNEVTECKNNELGFFRVPSRFTNIRKPPISQFYYDEHRISTKEI